jgi:hypothetical protein
VEAAGDLVGILVEFSAGMELGHDHFGGRDTFGLVNVGWNATAIVGDSAGAIGIERDGDAVAWPASVSSMALSTTSRPCDAGLSHRRCRRYTCRAFAPHGIKAFQHLDGIGVMGWHFGLVGLWHQVSLHLRSGVPASTAKHWAPRLTLQINGRRPVIRLDFPAPQSGKPLPALPVQKWAATSSNK